MAERILNTNLYVKYKLLNLNRKWKILGNYGVVGEIDFFLLKYFSDSKKMFSKKNRWGKKEHLTKNNCNCGVDALLKENLFTKRCRVL